MTDIRALLVDLDGTLVDTREANFAAYQAVLAERGADLARDWWRAHAFGRSWRQFLPQILGDRDAAELQAIAEAKARIYPTFLNRSSVNHSLVSLIRSMQPKVRAALVTTASRSNAEAVLELHGLRQLFETLVTGDDVVAHKPAPDAFAEAARRLHLTADECLIFEDSDIGIAAAQAFGATCFRVCDFARAA